MDILIRDVRPADAEPIVGILNPIIEAGSFTVLDTPLTGDDERWFILSFPQRGVFHVAEDRSSGSLVGFQTLEPFASYTHAFDHVAVIATFVDLRYTGQGIGTCLFEATFAAACRRGYEKIFTYVRADNTVALKAYGAQGFQTIGRARRHARIGGRYVDEIVIERHL